MTEPKKCEACRKPGGPFWSDMVTAHHALLTAAKEREERLMAAGKVLETELGNLLMVTESRVRNALNRENSVPDLLEIQSYCRGVGKATEKARRALEGGSK